MKKQLTHSGGHKDLRVFLAEHIETAQRQTSSIRVDFYFANPTYGQDGFDWILEIHHSGRYSTRDPYDDALPRILREASKRIDEQREQQGTRRSENASGD